MGLIQRGDVLTLTAGAGGVTKDDIVAGTNRAVIAMETAASGVSYAAAVEGVFQVTKESAQAFTVLDQVFAVTTGGSVVPRNTGTIALGYATAVAATGETTLNVKLAGF